MDIKLNMRLLGLRINERVDILMNEINEAKDMPSPCKWSVIDPRMPQEKRLEICEPSQLGFKNELTVSKKRRGW
jgi:hypothetical protein